MAVFSIRRFAIKQLMKAGDDGIMKMPSDMKADFAEAMLTKQLIDAGIDPRTIKNEQQMINVLDAIDNAKKTEKVTSTPKKVTSNVVDMKGKKLDESKPIIGGSQEGGLDNIFNEMYEDFQKDKLKFMRGDDKPPPGSRGGKEDIAAPVQSAEETLKNMTEAELREKLIRENKEAVARIKNKKLIDDAIDNVSPGFSGDRRTDAELVAQEIAERRGLNIDDLDTRQRASIYGEAYEALTKKKFDPDNNMAQGGRVGLFKGAQADASAGKGSMSPGTDTRGNVRDDNPFTGGGGGDGPKGPPSVISKPPKTNPIVERLKKRNLTGDSPFKKFLAHDRFTDMMKTINTPNYHQMGGLDFMARFPNMNPEIAKTLASAYQNVFELGRAIKDGPGGKTIKDALDTAKKEAALNAIGIDAFSDPTSEIYKQYTSDNFQLKPAAVQMAEGGRIGLKDGMDRRTFLKIMGGLASIPILGKFFKGAKVASKAAPVAMESATRSEAPTYFLKLVDKITKQGRPTTSTEDIMETYIYKGKNGDEYELVNDLKTGDIRITKDKPGVGSYNEETFDTIQDRTVMEYKAPRQDVDVETGRGTREAPEYEEYKVEFDMDGTEAGAEAIEETIQKEIIEESAEEAPSIKKADGGRVGLLSGGGILRTILMNLAKDKGMKPSDYLRLTNYKALPNEAKRIISKDEFLKLKSDMTEKRIELMDTVKNMIITRQNFEKSKADLAAGMNKASPGYGDKAVEMMFPDSMFPSAVPSGSGQKDVLMMEQLLKNLKTKDRQLNASGGVAYMLGE